MSELTAWAESACTSALSATAHATMVLRRTARYSTSWEALRSRRAADARVSPPDPGPARIVTATYAPGGVSSHSRTLTIPSFSWSSQPEVGMSGRAVARVCVMAQREGRRVVDDPAHVLDARRRQVVADRVLDEVARFGRPGLGGVRGRRDDEGRGGGGEEELAHRGPNGRERQSWRLTTSHRAGEQQLALAIVLAEVGGADERLARLGQAPEADEDVAAHAGSRW